MRWLFVTVLAGCFSPEPTAGAPCADGMRCPSGLSCVAGVCVDDDEPADECAGLPDGTPCGSASASDCDGADTCAAGACARNEVADGAACYDCAAGGGLCLSCADAACANAACDLAGAPVAGALVSPIVGNNGDEGNMFDIVATQTITITSFETHSSDTGMTDYEIYTKLGTHVGSETDANAWTRVGVASFALAGLNTYSPIPIPVDIMIAAGERRAFYLTNKARNNRYHNGTAVGDVLVQTPELTIYQGTGNNYGTTGFAGTAAPRAWEGKVHYRSGGGQTLRTSLAGTVSTGGVMFDVTAQRDLEVTLLAAHLAPGAHDVDIYWKRGSHAGAESNVMQWERAAQLPGVVSAGSKTPTNLPLAAPIFIADGATAAFYIATSGQLLVTAGAAGAMNGDVAIGAGVTVPAMFGGAGMAAQPNVDLGYGACR